MQNLLEKLTQYIDDEYSEDIGHYLEEVQRKRDNNFGAKFEANNDTINYDSYGSENSDLERIIYYSDFDTYVKFIGTRQSYSGTEWNNFVIVKPAKKTIKYFKEI